MPDYGIPVDTTDATYRAGHLAQAVNATGYATRDLDVRVTGAQATADSAQADATTALDRLDTHQDTLDAHEDAISELQSRFGGEIGAAAGGNRIGWFDPIDETPGEVVEDPRDGDIAVGYAAPFPLHRYREAELGWVFVTFLGGSSGGAGAPPATSVTVLTVFSPSSFSYQAEGSSTPTVINATGYGLIPGDVVTIVSHTDGTPRAVGLENRLDALPPVAPPPPATPPADEGDTGFGGGGGSF